MDKESLEKIRAMLSEELQPIKNDIKKLKKGQERLEISQERLEKGQESLKEDVEGLKEGQKEIRDLIGELDPQNASRHLELKSSISELRKDLSTVEVVTASNYSDIVRLKNIK